MLAWFITLLLALVSLKAPAAAYYGLLSLVSLLSAGLTIISAMVGKDLGEHTLPFWFGAWALSFGLTFAINFFFSQAMAFALLAFVDLVKGL